MDLNRFVLDGQNTPWVSVSVERVDQCGLHAGIVYRDADDNLHRLHFGWHRILFSAPYGKEDVPYAARVACALPLLEKEDAMWVSAFCGKIARHAPEKKIPYNLKYDEDVAFDKDTGDIILGVNSTGLGCATFVLAVFRCSANPLVDVTDWPDSTADDKSTQQRFVDALLL